MFSLPPPLNDAHNTVTVGIPTIYLIQVEACGKLEYQGPTVGPAKTIRDAKNKIVAHSLVKQKQRKYLPNLVIFFKLAKVVISLQEVNIQT